MMALINLILSEMLKINFLVKKGISNLDSSSFLGSVTRLNFLLSYPSSASMLIRPNYVVEKI